MRFHIHKFGLMKHYRNGWRSRFTGDFHFTNYVHVVACYRCGKRWDS
jgi:hypothetical protein